MSDLLTLDDIVERLGHTPDYWKRRIPKFEHLRVGREIRMTQEQYEAMRDSFVVRPEHRVTSEPDPLRDWAPRSRARTATRRTGLAS